MNRIEKDIYVMEYQIPPRIHYVQSTNTIPIVLTIKDYSIQPGSTARVYVKRPDGTAEYDNAYISGNTVTVSVKKTMFSVVGDSRMQIRIAKGENVLVSFEVIVDVRKNHADGGIKSENVTDIFDETLEGLDEAARKATIKADEEQLLQRRRRNPSKRPAPVKKLQKKLNRDQQRRRRQHREARIQQEPKRGRQQRRRRQHREARIQQEPKQRRQQHRRQQH